MLLSLQLASCKEPDVPVVVGPPEVISIDRASGITELCWDLRELVFEHALYPSRTFAQIEQESSCRVRVKSWDNGIGIAQFTGKKNTEWIARTYCADLGSPKPELAEWSAICMERYMRSFDKEGLTACQGLRFDESCYNGGCGWINREQKLAKAAGVDPRNYSKVREFCGRTKRSNKACGWNREYTEHIDRRQTKYLSYGGNICAD